MRKFLFLLLLFPTITYGLTLASVETGKIENKTFKPFDCSKLETEHLRINNRNDCLIIHELSNKYNVKSHDVDPNTWNRPLLLRHISNKDGEKIVAHTWNNVVKWGESSNKQPLSHLVVIDMPDLSELYKNSINQISSKLYNLPLTARRVDTFDADNDGDEEIIYLSNKEDGRNRNSSWKDVNYIFDLNDNALSKFGSSHFSHDLMYTDFDKDGYFEVIDYFYDPGGQIEVCNLKTNKCTKTKNSSQFIDIGFNHILQSKGETILFGGCPNLGDTSFCWSKIDYKNDKLSFEKLDSFELKSKPTDEAQFLIWTGDVQKKPGYWVKDTNKKEFKLADRAWMSASIDFNNDGYIDSLGIEKEVVCKRKDTSKPYSRSKGDCKDEAYLHVFKNLNNKKFENHQVIPTSINDAFRIEKADINKDGTLDVYGFKQGYYNPWMACKYPQLKSIYLNKKNEYFEHASSNFIKENFGLYGCERASNFFEKDNQYYRIFITIPNEESEIAYLGIENYTGKLTASEKEEVNTDQLNALDDLLDLE